MTGEEIKKHRMAKGWTQEQAAKRMGVSQSTFSQWESGTRDPTDMGMKVLEALFLFGGQVQGMKGPDETQR